MSTKPEDIATLVARASPALAPGEPLNGESIDLAVARIAATASGNVGAIDSNVSLAFVQGNPVSMDQARENLRGCTMVLLPVLCDEDWVLYTYDDYDAKIQRYDSICGESKAADEAVYALLSALFERDMKSISGDVEFASASIVFPLFILDRC